MTNLTTSTAGSTTSPMKFDMKTRLREEAAIAPDAVATGPVH